MCDGLKEVLMCIMAKFVLIMYNTPVQISSFE